MLKDIKLDLMKMNLIIFQNSKYNFKNMNLKKISRRSWMIIIIVALIIIPGTIIAVNWPTVEDSYDSYQNVDKKVIAREGWSQVKRIIINDSTKDYFVPNKTAGEWGAFRSNLPTGLSIVAPCSAGTTCGNPCFIEDEDTETVYMINTVSIGNQCWMTENLKINSGMTLWAHNQSGTSHNDRYSCMQANNNCVSNGEELFYQKFAIMDPYAQTSSWVRLPSEPGQYLWSDSTEKGRQGICPSGWRIPSIADIDELETESGCSEIGNGGEDRQFTATCLNGVGFNSSSYGYRHSLGDFFSPNCAYYVLSNGFYQQGQNTWHTLILGIRHAGNACPYTNARHVQYGVNVRCMKGGTTNGESSRDGDEGGEEQL